MLNYYLSRVTLLQGATMRQGEVSVQVLRLWPLFKVAQLRTDGSDPWRNSLALSYSILVSASGHICIRYWWECVQLAQSPWRAKGCPRSSFQIGKQDSRTPQRGFCHIRQEPCIPRESAAAESSISSSVDAFHLKEKSMTTTNRSSCDKRLLLGASLFHRPD